MIAVPDVLPAVALESMVAVAELPSVAVAPEAPDANFEEAPVASAPTLLAWPRISPAAVANPPNPEYVCK